MKTHELGLVEFKKPPSDSIRGRIYAVMCHRIVMLQKRQERAQIQFDYARSLFAGAPKLGADTLQSAYVERMLSISGSSETVDNLKRRQAALQKQRYEEITGLQFGTPEMDEAVDRVCDAILGK